MNAIYYNNDWYQVSSWRTWCTLDKGLSGSSYSWTLLFGSKSRLRFLIAGGAAVSVFPACASVSLGAATLSTLIALVASAGRVSWVSDAAPSKSGSSETIGVSFAFRRLARFFGTLDWASCLSFSWIVLAISCPLGTLFLPSSEFLSWSSFASPASSFSVAFAVS